MNKNILLIAFFLIPPTLASCQYYPMLNEGSEWYHYFWFEASCNHRLVVNGDTTMNNVTYKKVVNEGDLCNYPYYTFAREDVLNKQVYYHYFDTTEILIYDFSLVAGDTISSTFQYYQFELVVDSITSSLPQGFSSPELNIDMPKVFYLSAAGCTSCDQIIWVEGIGNIADPFNCDVPWTSGALGDVLLCHYDETGFRDYHYVYEEESVPCQGPIVSTEKIKVNTKIRFSPNPFKDKIRLDVTDSGMTIKEIEVYNSTGQLIRKENDFSGNTLNLSGFPPGLIYVLIRTNNGGVITRKLIKK